MPEKPSERNRDEAKAPEGGKRGKGKFMLVGAVGGAMLIEGVGVFVLARMMGSGPKEASANVEGLAPAGAHGASSGAAGARGGAGGEAAKVETQESELLLAQFRAINDRSGQNILYDVKVYGRVKGDKLEKVQKLLEGKKASIEDRFAKVIRTADPQYFKEPGLETIRRQVLHELDTVFGEEELVCEILLPSLMWFNAGG
jgi:hypothetical protein